MRTIARLEVGLKGFVTRAGRLLVVRERVAPQWWELPGGRIDAGEEAEALEGILRRELREELGESLTYDVAGPRDAWIRPAPERGTHVFLVGFECRWRAGEVALSDEHVESRWIAPGEERALPFAAPYPDVLARFWARGIA